MSKYKVEDVVLVYEQTPTFEHGAVCQVIDKDANAEEYLVADLRDVGKADRDINVILQYYAKWVKPENMRKLSFEREQSFWRRIFG
jgi:hypothetical protein